jgi:transcription termination factor Rho
MYDISQLNNMLLPDLREIAKKMGLRRIDLLKKQELVYRILDQQAVLETENTERKEREDKPEQGRDKANQQNRPNNPRFNNPRPNNPKPNVPNTANPRANTPGPVAPNPNSLRPNTPNVQKQDNPIKPTAAEDKPAETAKVNPQEKLTDAEKTAEQEKQKRNRRKRFSRDKSRIFPLNHVPDNAQSNGEKQIKHDRPQKSDKSNWVDGPMELKFPEEPQKPAMPTVDAVKDDAFLTENLFSVDNEIPVIPDEEDMVQLSSQQENDNELSASDADKEDEFIPAPVELFNPTVVDLPSHSRKKYGCSIPMPVRIGINIFSQETTTSAAFPERTTGIAPRTGRHCFCRRRY